MTEPHCGAEGIYWPARCILPPGHQPANTHRDAEFGEWSSDEVMTRYRLPIDDISMAHELWMASPDGQAYLKAQLDTLKPGQMTIDLSQGEWK